MVEWSAFVGFSFSTSAMYALWFLLGSQTVAGLSDIRRMAAQREFMEVWILFAIVVLAMDGYRLYAGADWLVLAVKWGLILAVALLSWEKVGGLFHLARGDVWAIVAVCALFNPLFVLVYAVLLKLADLIMRPGLRAFGSGKAYPFLPVVIAATIATVVLILTRIIERGLAVVGWA